MGNRKSQKLKRLESEVSALGYSLERRYVIQDGFGHVEQSFSKLDEVSKWIGREESRRLGDAGGDYE